MEDFGMRVVVIVPTYNESENIERIVDAVRVHGYDLLVVDDGSPDGTGQIVEDLSRVDPGVLVLHRGEKTGLGPAYAAGFEHCLELGYEILCEMDADFSHNPDDLIKLLEACEKDGFDMAICSQRIAD